MRQTWCLCLRGVSLMAGMLLASAVVPAAAPAQTGPPEPDESRFQKVLLEGEGLTQPMRIRVAPDGRVVYIERDGRVKVWDPDTQSTQVAGTVAVRVTGETGHGGAGAGARFRVHRPYLFALLAPGLARRHSCQRVSRFTLRADNTLEPGSEVKIIDIQHPQGVGGGHSAGDLRITADGLLFINTGDNTNCCAAAGFAPLDERPGRDSADAQKTSANTNDLNGKILRIRPLAQGGYDDPGRQPVRTERRLPGRGRQDASGDLRHGLSQPVHARGLDPATGALWMADYGPDAVLGDPERGPAGLCGVNLITEAGFFGWPYCVADNKPYRDWDFATEAPKGGWFDCDESGQRLAQQHGTGGPAARPAGHHLLDLHRGGAVPGALRRRSDGRPALRVRRRQPVNDQVPGVVRRPAVLL